MRNLRLALPVMFLATALYADPLELVPLTTFGTNNDGSVRPGDVSWLTSDGGRLQRGMAYNPVTGHLILVNRSPLGSETIISIDATYGTNISQLDTSSPGLGGSANFIYNMAGVAEDGAIYVGNLTTSSALVTFNLYRWDNESAAQTLVYSGDPRGGNTVTANARWGDALAVRGSGVNTEILIGTQSGTMAALLRPVDATMASFYATPLQTDAPAGSVGYGLAFGAGNTFWAKDASAEGNPLRRFSYDALNSTATTLKVFGLHEFPGRVGPLGVLVQSNLLAAIEMVSDPDRVRLYDITDLNNPVFLDRESFATNAPNNVYAGAAVFGGTNLYALNGDNGIQAYTLVTSASVLAPLIIRDPTSALAQVSSNVTFVVGADGTAPLSYQWRVGGTAINGATQQSYSITNLMVNHSGAYDVVVTNAFGSITSAVANLTVIELIGDALAYDPFSYPVGQPLSGQGGWIVTSGTAGNVVAGSLSYPGLAASAGGAYAYGSNSNVRSPFITQTNGSIYFSLLYRMDELGWGTASDTAAGFTLGNTGTTFPLKINTLSNSPGFYQIGLYKAAGTSFGQLLPDLFAVGQTVMIVGRYNFNPNSATDDTCDIWINPDASTFGKNTSPAPTLGGIGDGGADGVSIERFFFRSAGTQHGRKTVDELRVGMSWAEVTPAFVPNLKVALNGTSMDLTWSTNASGFTLEGSATLSPVSWSTVADPVTVSGADYKVTVNATVGTRFFRLNKPSN